MVFKWVNYPGARQVLRQLHKAPEKDSIIIEQDPENWRTTTSTMLGRGIPLAASVGRSIVFWYIIDDLLNSLGLPFGEARQFLSISLGEIIAAAFQGKMEWDTVHKAISDMLFTDDEGEISHNPWWKTCRILGKGYTYIQGAWNTLPYMLAGTKATRFWPTWTRVVTLLPFGIADMCNNSICFQESYADVLGAAESVAAHYGQVTPGYMRKTLIGLAKKFHNLYNSLHPNVVIKLELLLSGELKTDNELHAVDILSSHIVQ
ncbi:MAG: hypothetical protein H0X26_09770 [Alphaproteobacteria bacterium]|nr:hypothetical protein [Alphaproteobacteria bacterium]